MHVLRVVAAVFMLLPSFQPSTAGLADAKQFRQILSGTLELDRPTEIASRRLVFNDYTIITNGFPLVISADTLTIAGKSRIVSFAPRAILAEQPGRSAGTITLNVRDIDGETLIIENVGEPGGPGIRGTTGVAGVAGTDGGAATTGWPGRCQPGAQGGRGGEGGRGLDGGDGAAGGGGGDVLLNVRHDRDKLDIKTAGGRGGAAGEGGAGGPGGPGGAAGSGTARCLGGAPGDPGPDGPPGAAGRPGSSGPAGRVLTGAYDESMGVKR